jgi:stringent starvation protein B
MPPLPRKKAVALDLLERTSVYVHLDPRRPGVIVPQGFLKQPQLVLQIGLNMAIQIPDLDVGEEGITCTLSFNKRPHFCSLPWSAIYALIGEQGGGMVWPEDVPAEVVSQQRSAAKKEARPRRPGLRAISGSADRNLGDEDGLADVAPGSDSGSDSGSEREGRGPGSAPPRLVISRSEVGAPPEASAEAEAVAGEVKKPDSSTRPQEGAARTACAKRSRPPYLRLVD